MKGYRKKISKRVNIQPRKKKTLKIHRNKSKKIRRGGTMIPTNASHKIGKSIMLTIHPSKLDNSKFISNISVSGYNNNIDETLSSMVKSLNHTHQLERPVYSRKISIDSRKKELLPQSNIEKLDESNIYNLNKKYYHPISSKEFSEKYKTFIVKGDGNCLFYSLAHELEKNNVQTDHRGIRKSIATIYENIKQQQRLIVNPVTNNKLNNIDVTRLQILLKTEIFDREDGGMHSDKVGNDRIYGNIMDILTASILYDTNIFVYQKSKNRNEYSIIPFTKEGVTKNPPLQLLYEGDHYNALDLKVNK